MKWWVQHLRPGHPTEFHIVYTPNVSEDGFYRQTTSISAFDTREKNRRFPFSKDGKPLYPTIYGMPIECCQVERYSEMLDRHEWSNDGLKLLGKPARAIPQATEHQSVWAFYKAIGYDYKNQRYTEVTPCK